MDRLPQNISYNPAFIPNVKFYLGLPGIGGISANAYNSGFNYDGIKGFTDNYGNSGYNPDEFVKSIGDNNRFTAETKENIFSMGFKLKEKGYFSFGLTMNSLVSLKTGSGIAYFLADKDKISHADFPIRVDDVDFLANNYLTMSFTYSRKLNEQLTIGISPNINFNIAGIKAKGVSYIINLKNPQSSKREYDETFFGDLVLGLPVEINPVAIAGGKLDSDQNFLRDNWGDDVSISDLLKNKSLSLNLGATYSLEQWVFSASILNIGASSWKNNGYRFIGDNEITLVSEVPKIKIGIPTKIYIAANRQFTPKWNYGLVLNNTFYYSGSNASATLSLNGGVGRMLSTSFSYTAGYKFNNIGWGIRLRFFPGTDLYFVTDNITQLLNYKSAYRVSAAFGINLAFGVKQFSSSVKESEEDPEKLIKN